MSANFINLIPELHFQQYSNQIMEIIKNKIPCGFFCGFGVPESVSEIVENLKDTGINLTCICVLADSQMGGGIEDIPCVTLEEFANLEDKPQIILHSSDIITPIFREYFLRFGVDMFSLENIENSKAYYDFYIQNLPQLYEVYEMLAAFIKGKLTQNTKDHIFAPEPQYFLEGFLPTEGDIAIDGGAYDGATSRDFAMQGAEVYAFEMSAENYKKCLERAEKYNFVVENLGLSIREGEEFYIEGGTTSSKGHGNSVAKFTDLDTYVNKKNLPRVDYIKLDIEGAELDMLQGAAKTIARWKPKMAVSAYHKLEDLWTLALYIKSIRPDYEFQFRHYKIDCTDYTLTDAHREILKYFGLSYFLSSYCEKVLYCR